MTDPTEIHPEHDALTPENEDDWSEEQKDAYKQAKQSELRVDAEQSRAELARDERETLDFLRSATEDPASEHTESINLGEALGAPDDVHVTVRTKLTGELESKFDRITDEQQKDHTRITNIKDAVVGAITLLIVDDDEPGDDPYDFQSRAVWEAYYAEHGSEDLMDVFEAVADPALTRYERLGNSRGRTSR